MVNHCSALIFLIVSLSSSTKSLLTFSPTTYSRNYTLSRSLLRRKISDSNSQPQVINDMHNLAGCPGDICGTLAGEAVQPLLAGAGECAQQDMADKMIDMAKTQLRDENVKNKLIELAKIYRQSERNTFPDYSSPSTPDTNSLYCQKEPKNSELSGLIQAQSKTADPNLFFDPKVNGKSVKKGADPRTKPFGGSKVQTSSFNSTLRNPETDDGQGQEIKKSKTSDSTRNGDNESSKKSSSLTSMEPDSTQKKSLTTNLDTGNVEMPETDATISSNSENQDASTIQSSQSDSKSKSKIRACRRKTKA